jgi:hypothetical protein
VHPPTSPSPYERPSLHSAPSWVSSLQRSVPAPYVLRVPWLCSVPMSTQTPSVFWDDGAPTSCFGASRCKHNRSCVTSLGGCSKAPTTFFYQTKTSTTHRTSDASLFYSILFLFLISVVSQPSILSGSPAHPACSCACHMFHRSSGGAGSTIPAHCRGDEPNSTGSCKSRLYHHSLLSACYNCRSGAPSRSDFSHCRLGDSRRR